MSSLAFLARLHIGGKRTAAFVDHAGYILGEGFDFGRGHLECIPGRVLARCRDRRAVRLRSGFSRPLGNLLRRNRVVDRYLLRIVVHTQPAVAQEAAQFTDSRLTSE
jgi:hypothetical protein